jgi:S1-C subfamily serine protease
MNGNLKWLAGTLACVAAAVAATWYFVHKEPSTVSHPSGKNEDTVKIMVAYSKPLMLSYAYQSDPNAIAKVLFDSNIKLPNGKRIEIDRIGLSSREMVDGVLSGTLKAHIIVPSSEVFLELADRESTMRTGKPLISEKVVFMQQPSVLAVRRPMAEAMGWPNKEFGWSEVVDIARNGWKSAGHPEWGPLKLIIGNPNLSDSGVHAVVSASLAILGKSKGLTADDMSSPALTGAIKALDRAVVWYPPSIEDFVRNEALGVPPQCHMTCLPEHLLRTLNESSTRRKGPPEWVAIYPDKGTIVDNIVAAVVKRDWVTDEQREAATTAVKMLKNPEVQQRVAVLGHRPALTTISLTEHLKESMGVDPKRPRERIDLPTAEVVLDCVNAWNNEWKSKNRDTGATVSTTTSTSATADAPHSLKKLTMLSPTVQCVRRATPCTVCIKHADTKAVRGTGVVVDGRGYAVTNYHVVGKDKLVAVNLLAGDDKLYSGQVMWSDPNQDLAIIRIAGNSRFPAIKYGDASDREIGETVIAIGNPLGYTGTVTVGIVSAMGREITLPTTGAVLQKLIQTDAGINPGNSGGPLLDIEGQLVGIVFAMREGAQNIAFAIPVDRVRDYVKKHVPAE